MNYKNCKQVTTFAANGEAHPYEKTIAITLESDEARHIESGALNLYPKLEYQTIEGFGGAMTETSAYLLSKMSAETRRAALTDWFCKEGHNARFVRMHMDSCDYSLDEYQSVEDPIADPEFKTFNIDRDRKYMLPMLKEAMEIAEHPISVLLSPWSPPKQWKTPPARPKNDASVYGAFMRNMPPVDYDNPGRCNGGSLRPEFYGPWARYMVKFVQAYLDEGVNVTMLSIQNETLAATNWDSCVWTAEQEKTFLRDHLYPAMRDAGLLDKVGIYIFDHNKERIYERVQDILDDVTAPMIEGIAFHWYSGDHFEAVQMVKDAYPDKVLMLSECCELHQPGRAGFGGFFGMGNSDTPESIEYNDAVHYAHDIIGNLNSGMNRWIDWNLIVDKDGGPRHVPGGFCACMTANDDGSYRKVLSFHYIGHFMKYIKGGAKRIGFSRGDDKIEVTAAKNPDGSLVCVVLNKGDKDQAAAIRLEGQVIRAQFPARTISTLTIE